MLPIICFVGDSGSGKTTLLEKVVGGLSKRGVRVAAVKHTHHDVPLDTPGKDTARLARAGSEVVALITSKGLAWFQPTEEEPPLTELAATLEGRVDIILAEGYKHSDHPKIEFVKPGALPASPASELIAVVSDGEASVEVPRFSRDDIEGILGFLLERLPISS